MVAIAMLTADPQVEVVGISTVFGNATVDQTTRNAKVIMEAAGLNKTPIARGASRPLCIPLDTSPFVHGDNGMGNMTLPDTIMEEFDQFAPQAIIDAILREPLALTLMAIGPLTNLAIACNLEPRICQSVKEVIIMGGAVHCAGNITPAAEANFFHDPHAAQIVVSAGWPITLAGLDVNNQAMVPDHILKNICNSSKPLSHLIAGSLPHYQGFLESLGIQGQVDFPDALAAAYLLKPEIFTIKMHSLFVETEGSCIGQSLSLPDNKWYQDPEDSRLFKPDELKGKVHVLEQVDAAKFLELMEDLLI